MKKPANKLTSTTISGIEMPDWTFVVSDSAEIVETVSGHAAAGEFPGGRHEGTCLTDGLPEGTAALIRRSIGKAMRSRSPVSLDFCIDDDAVHYELRLIPIGRNRLLGVLRDLELFPLPKTSRLMGGTTSARLKTSDMLLDSLIGEAELRERGLAVLVIGFQQLADLTKRIGKSVRREMFGIAARRIEECLRSDDRVADDDPGADLVKLGGDEFLVMLRDVEQRDDAASIADRIRTAFDHPLAHGGNQFSVSPTIGIALFPTDGASSEDLLKHARVALDEASIRGADGYEFYSSTMRFRAMQRLDGRDELKWAIDNDQLGLRYLPRIDLATGRVAGLEALLRWEHPLRGLVALDEVLPLAEATGLMRPLGEWVLESACAQATSWRREIDNLPPVSVNLSESEFTRNGLGAVVLNALEAAALPPDALELEVRESTLMRTPEADRILGELDAIGIGLVIDDFGAGYSSLGRLTKLPVKAIKIDRSFVDRCQVDDSKRSVCSAIIALATGLGLTVIAEGVETAEQIELLREQGCHALQGFFISEPLRPEEVPGFIAPHLSAVPDGTVVDLDTIRTRFRLTGAI